MTTAIKLTKQNRNTLAKQHVEMQKAVAAYLAAKEIKEKWYNLLNAYETQVTREIVAAAEVEWGQTTETMSDEQDDLLDERISAVIRAEYIRRGYITADAPQRCYQFSPLSLAWDMFIETRRNLLDIMERNITFATGRKISTLYKEAIVIEEAIEMAKTELV